LESVRLEGVLQAGQAASSFTSQSGRSCSNFVLQAGQKYSYIGIFLPLFKF
jgi:hypothetical protein